MAIKAALPFGYHKDAEYEWHMLRAVQESDHIVQAIDYMVDFQSAACIVMEIADCDLEHFISLFGSNVCKPSIIRTFAGQLLEALSHLSGLGVCHCDVKPANVLMYESCRTLKLADFGWSCFVAEDLAWPVGVTLQSMVARARDSAGLHLLDIYRERCAMGRRIIASFIHTGCVQTFSHIPMRSSCSPLSLGHVVAWLHPSSVLPQQAPHHTKLRRAATHRAVGPYWMAS